MSYPAYLRFVRQVTEADSRRLIIQLSNNREHSCNTISIRIPSRILIDVDINKNGTLRWQVKRLSCIAPQDNSFFRTPTKGRIYRTVTRGVTQTDLLELSGPIRRYLNTCSRRYGATI